MAETSDSARLAGEMHTTQWALDDLAHEVSADRDDPEKLTELADRMEKLAKVLRLRSGNRTIGARLEQP